MPIFREIEEGRVGKRPFLQPLTWFGRYISYRMYLVMAPNLIFNDFPLVQRWIVELVELDVIKDQKLAGLMRLKGSDFIQTYVVKTLHSTPHENFTLMRVKRHT
jgi:hypothetical protein